MKWGIAAVVGVLLAYPVNLLMQCVAQLAVGSDSIWVLGWGLVRAERADVHFLSPAGHVLASLQNLRASGAGRRFWWPEFALGMFLFVMSVVMKLEQATGLVAAAGFVRSSEILTQIVTFDDSLHLWVVLAGFFMTHAFERVSEESMARAAALRAQAAQARIARKNAPKNGRKTSAKSAEPTASPPVGGPARRPADRSAAHSGPGQAPSRTRSAAHSGPVQAPSRPGSRRPKRPSQTPPKPARPRTRSHDPASCGDRLSHYSMISATKGCRAATHSGKIHDVLEVVRKNQRPPGSSILRMQVPDRSRPRGRP
jgi:hypothetical protein